LIQIDKREIVSCCGKKQMIWKLNTPIKKDHLEIFQRAGFSFVKTYIDAGMIYIEDKGLTATGVFGMNQFTIKCKNAKCEESAKLLERTILAYL
jgi:hypothetical protein